MDDGANSARYLELLQLEGRKEPQIHQVTLPPLLPSLVDLDGDEGETLDRDTDHALLLLGLTAMKFHPRSPVPIPSEALLYEAWMTETENVRIPGIRPWVRSVKAYLYGTHDLCDLAKRETDRLGSEPPPPVDAVALISGLGRLAAHAPQGAALIAVVAVLPTVMRILAHGATAICYRGRGEDGKAAEEIQRLVDVAEASGVPPRDTAILRAFVAYQAGDLERTRVHLTQSKQSALFDDDGRAELDELIAYLDQGERGPLAGYFDKAFLGAFVARIAFARLDAANAGEAVGDAALFARLRDFADAVSRGITTAQETVGGWSERRDTLLDGLSCSGAP